MTTLAGVFVLSSFLLPRSASSQAISLVQPSSLATVSVQEASPGTQASLFGLGGRFAGDLDGDGVDEIIAQSREGTRLRVWFGNPEWRGSTPLELSAGGALSLDVPESCAPQGGLLRYRALGDVNADGFDDVGLSCWGAVGSSSEALGSVHVWLGAPQPWASSLVSPDWSLDGALGLGQVGADVVALHSRSTGELEYLVVAGAVSSDATLSKVWFFSPASLNGTSVPSLSEASFSLEGSPTARCMEPVELRSLGDFDGDGFSDLGVVCPRQPGVQDPGADNVEDIGLSLLLSLDLSSLNGEEDLVSVRSLSWEGSGDFVAQAPDFAELGDLDADGYGEIALVAWDADQAENMGQVLRGSAEPSPVVGVSSNYAPFFLGGSTGDGGALQMAPAGSLPGQEEPGVWLRWGPAAQEQIGLLGTLDPNSWDDPQQPQIVFGLTPEGATPLEDSRRFRLGGPGDADGDGVLDLLIFGGHDGGDCLPETCGGFWLILCGDADGDGSSACAGDCDDGDPSRSPLAVELCDSEDHDCDGDDGQTDFDGDGVQVCEGDCDDDDPDRSPAAEETCEDTEDRNCDGLISSEDVDGDGVRSCDDCDPWNAATMPGAFELCDGLDNDCDGVLPTNETDFDGDGWLACGQDGRPADCNDTAPFIHPGRFEDCGNGLDDDCDGEVDEDEDLDGDGVRTCDGDCDDSHSDVFPGAEELCDGLDNDCDGLTDNPRDEDGDGVSVCAGDCDDADEARHAGAPPQCTGALDANCDGVDDLIDGDSDGWSACAGDCDDGDPGVSPVAEDYCDGRDNDCDGVADQDFDQDGDGWSSCLGDCSDTEADRYPQRTEPDCADGVDGDCDLIADLGDPDCQETAEPSVPTDDLELPYGIRCDGCSSSPGVHDRGGVALLFGVVLLLWIRRSAALARCDDRRVRWAGRGLLFLCSLMLVSPSPAEAAKKEKVLVVYLAGQPDIQAMVAARELLSGFDPVDIIHSSELLEEAPEQILVEGVPRAYSCPSGGNHPELIESAGRVLDRVIQLDYRGALRIYEHVMRELPCLDVPLAQGVLTDLLYYRGMALLGSGDLPGAQAAFRNLLGIEVDYAGDPNFPPESNQVLEDVRKEHRTWPWLSVEAFVRSGSILRVDGQDWDPTTRSLNLNPGMHVLQYRRRGSTWTSVIDLREDNKVFVLHSLDRTAALKNARRSPAARGWSAGRLSRAASRSEVDLVAVVDLEESPARILYTYRSFDGVFSFDPMREANTSAGRQRAAERKKQEQLGRKKRRDVGPRSMNSGGASSVPLGAYSDRVRVRLSLGYAYVHPFSYALIPLQVSVRLVAGLSLDIGGEIGLNQRSDVGLTLLPSGQLGASYHFEFGAFHPRVGALMRVGVDQPSTEAEGPKPLLGWAGRVGFDVGIGSSAGLVSVEAQAGMYGKPLFASITAGGGFRF